jgi:hypothetical protein
VPITLLGTGGVKPDDAGLASGLFNTAQQVGGSLGLAILSTLAATHTANLLHSTDGLASVAARVSGYHVAFAAAAIMMASAAVLMAVGLRREHMREVEVELSSSATGVTSVTTA